MLRFRCNLGRKSSLPSRIVTAVTLPTLKTNMVWRYFASQKIGYCESYHSYISGKEGRSLANSPGRKRVMWSSFYRARLTDCFSVCQIEVSLFLVPPPNSKPRHAGAKSFHRDWQYHHRKRAQRHRGRRAHLSIRAGRISARYSQPPGG